jgi:flagellar hook-associated protein 3 FlgL
MRSNSLWSINRNEELLSKYDLQLSTGKKIQKPSEDPIVAVRALKFRTNVKEISQYKTNSKDAVSWLNVTEQAMDNSINMLKRARDLCVQGSSDIFSSSDRKSIIAELEQLKSQFLNEANVNYAGRYIFSGYKTDKPATLIADQNTTTYAIKENLSAESLETIQKVVETATPGVYEIQDINRIRLGYSDLDGITTMTPAVDIGGLTINTMDSTSASAYEPAAGNVNFLKDTGELIFNSGDIATLPANFDFVYDKTNFVKGDLNPELFFDRVINTTTGETIPKPDDDMIYQISYNQDIVVNSMGNSLFTSELVRDFEEIIDAVKSIKDDETDEDELNKDLLGDFFKGMLTKLDKHINTFIREESIIGSKVNRLELTINRLDDDKINFTELLSLNENVDMTEAVLNLKSQEIVYNASLQASMALMQRSLMDFMR